MGNLKAIKSKINNNRYSYSFYYYNNQIVTYMIMTDTSFSEEVAVVFLDQLNELFNREVSVDEFNEVQHLPKEEVEGCLQSKFGDSLKGKIMSFKYDEEYEKIKNDGSINILESNVLKFKDTILKAQEQLITRGENVEVLNSKAEKLTENSVHVKNVPFVFDGNVLTGRGPGTAEQFAMKLVELTAGEQIADRIRISACQR